MIKHYLFFALVFITFNSRANEAANVIVETPIFNIPTQICAGEAAPLLPNISTNGITGTWNPSIVDNMQSATYIFTPDPGQDAESITHFITVMPFPGAVALQCDPQNSTENSVAFDWSNVPGYLSYNYSYTIDGGTAVYGNIMAPSHFTVTGLLPGQVVTFTIVSVEGVPCAASETVTCGTQILNSTDFQNQSFSIYPNPVENIVHITSIRHIEKIKVYDVLGHEVLNVEVNMKNPQIDLSCLTGGTYILKAVSESNSHTFRVVKK